MAAKKMLPEPKEKSVILNFKERESQAKKLEDKLEEDGITKAMFFRRMIELYLKGEIK